jgi:hypothetical protein
VTGTDAFSWPLSPSVTVASPIENDGGGPPAVTVWQAENSDVLPAGSVAVAVSERPTATSAGAVCRKLAWPLAFVVTSTAERNASPSPLPEVSHAAPSNSSTR